MMTAAKEIATENAQNVIRIKCEGLNCIAATTSFRIDYRAEI